MCVVGGCVAESTEAYFNLTEQHLPGFGLCLSPEGQGLAQETSQGGRLDL